MVEALRHAVNQASNPTTLYLGSSALLLFALWKIDWFVKPIVAGSMALLALLLFSFALFDDHFRHIVTLPDNIPITLMFVLLGFFTWHALRKASINDQREAEGKPSIEKEQDRRTMTWPNLVYIEFIALIGVTIFLIAWSVLFQAPLEEPGNPNLTPNPSKAPWYFLGLQEMLVYFDPWLAGVVFPGLIILGLAAIPYLDKNPKGNGYYSFKPRWFIVTFFLFGFIIQWALLILLGTFMRGPGWNFFGPFEPWDLHKVVALTNVNLSELLWVKLFGMGLPQNPLIREGLGIALLLGYYVGLPYWLAKTYFKKFYEELHPVAYVLLCILFLTFVLLPIKMLLRWTLNLKYIVAIPEFFFNI